ncbi:hypothetical protein [Hydrogenophaga soli]
MRIVVKSRIRSIEASRILEEVAASVKSQGLGVVERTTIQVPGTKGILVSEIVIQLVLGVAGNAVYDLVKNLVSRGIGRSNSNELTDDSISVAVEPDDERDSSSNGE